MVDHKTGWARIEVIDGGPLDNPPAIPADEADEYGRGLDLVDGTADRWGQNNDRTTHTRWAEFDWKSE